MSERRAGAEGSAAVSRGGARAGPAFPPAAALGVRGQSRHHPPR